MFIRQWTLPIISTCQLNLWHLHFSLTHVCLQCQHQHVNNPSVVMDVNSVFIIIHLNAAQCSIDLSESIFTSLSVYQPETRSKSTLET